MAEKTKAELMAEIKDLKRGIAFDRSQQDHIKELNCVIREREDQICHLKKTLGRATWHIRGDTYAAAADLYGEPSQINMAMEEMSELTKELSKRVRGEDNIYAISEEMADVEIMLEQLKHIFGNRSQVDIIRATKLDRLEHRIRSASNLL